MTPTANGVNGNRFHNPARPQTTTLTRREASPHGTPRIPCYEPQIAPSKSAVRAHRFPAERSVRAAGHSRANRPELRCGRGRPNRARRPRRQNLEVFSATIGRQLVELGLIDVSDLHIAPVLLGDGIRLFDNPGAHPSDSSCSTAMTHQPE